MRDFFDFLSNHGKGVFYLFLIAVGAMVIIQWIAWIFKLGRYREGFDKDKSSGIVYIVADFFVKIINDFRHLLALTIILVFAWVLVYSVIKAVGFDAKYGTDQNFENLRDVLQAVVSTLGGIVGSIIGYYFGESAGRKHMEKNVNDEFDSEPFDTDSEPIKEPSFSPPKDE